MDMELRSASRSRSRTPFHSGSMEREVIEGEYNITRVTRNTTYRSHESATAEISQSSSKSMKIRSGQRSRHKLIKTSDYSSEDGDNEVTSTDFENSSNSLKETRMNGAGYEALKMYRETPEYWIRYPKTDYTYSRHSKDRVEIAPGVVNMPNMSRRSIHESSDTETCNKETNTETQTLRPRSLFSNNNNNVQKSSIYSSHQSSSARTTTRTTTKITSVIRTVFLTIFGFIFQSAESSTSWVHRVSSWLHRCASKLMMIDTWILKSRTRSNKNSAVLALCLLPLIFGGLWWISALSRNPDTPIAQTATPIIPTKETHHPQVIEKVVKIQLDTPVKTGLTAHQLKQIAETLTTQLNLDVDTITKILMDDPNLVLIESTPTISDEQLEGIKQSLDVNTVVARVINSPSIQKLITSDNKNQQDTILHLQTQISQLQQDLVTKTTRLSTEISSCCRKNFLQIESYVATLLKRMLESDMHRDNLMGWLNAVFVAKDDLEARLTNSSVALKNDFKILLENNAKQLMDEIMRKLSSEMISKKGTTFENARVDDGYIRKLVKDSLALYDADKTGLVDYAMESAGGQIISTRCTESFQSGTAVFSIFGILLWYPTRTARTVITPGVSPGECWAFQSFPGFLIIKLATPITIDAFSYEHVSRSLVPTGHIDSAPKKFSVYGLRNETDMDATLIGDYVYDSQGDPLQYFTAQKPNMVFDMVELKVHSNHGNNKYTCLYRFRVHGKLYLEPT